MDQIYARDTDGVLWMMSSTRTIEKPDGSYLQGIIEPGFRMWYKRTRDRWPRDDCHFTVVAVQLERDGETVAITEIKNVIHVTPQDRLIAEMRVSSLPKEETRTNPSYLDQQVHVDWDRAAEVSFDGSKYYKAPNEKLENIAKDDFVTEFSFKLPEDVSARLKHAAAKLRETLVPGASEMAQGVEPQHLTYKWRREVPWDPEDY